MTDERTTAEMTAPRGASRNPYRVLAPTAIAHGPGLYKATVEVVAKTKGGPLGFGTEYAVSRLAQLLNLPTPPGFMAIMEDGEPAFCSLLFEDPFNPTLPRSPREIAAWVERHPDLAWGVTLFDLWVDGRDRSSHNFAIDPDRDAIYLYDNEGAFRELRQLCSTDPARPPAEELLAYHFITRSKREAPHSKLLRSTVGLKEWIDRIQSIPRWQIEDALRQAGEYLQQADEKYCLPRWEVFADWLDRRRALLRDLVLRGHECFGVDLEKLVEALT